MKAEPSGSLVPLAQELMPSACLVPVLMAAWAGASASARALRLAAVGPTAQPGPLPITAAVRVPDLEPAVLEPQASSRSAVEPAQVFHRGVALPTP